MVTNTFRQRGPGRPNPISSECCTRRRGDPGAPISATQRCRLPGLRSRFLHHDSKRIRLAENIERPDPRSLRGESSITSLIGPLPGGQRTQEPHGPTGSSPVAPSHSIQSPCFLSISTNLNTSIYPLWGGRGVDTYGNFLNREESRGVTMALPAFARPGLNE